MSERNMLPNHDLDLRDSRDFIVNSILARKALKSSSYVMFLSGLLIDLVEKIYYLAQSCQMPEYTDHGLPHVCSLIERISSWTIRSNENTVETNYFVDLIDEDDSAKLLIAILIHDLGMLSQSPRDLPDDTSAANKQENYSNISEWVRYTHVLRLDKLFKRILQELNVDINYNKITKLFVDEVIDIGGAHQEWAWEWDSAVLKGNNRVLAAIIAVVDLLDEDSARCDTMTLIKHRSGSELNIAHWIRHGLTGGRINIENSLVEIQLLKPVDCEAKHLNSVYAALRNHFRLIKLYNDELRVVNADVDVKFNHDNVPDEETLSLSGWNKLDAFQTEKALSIQLLNTFMPCALGKISSKQADYIDSVKLEPVDLCLYSAVRGRGKPKDMLEQTFCVLSDDNVEEGFKYLKRKALDAHIYGNGSEVLRLCLVAKRRLRITKEKLNLSVYGWCISLKIYWSTYYSGISFLDNDLSELLKNDNRATNAYQKFILWLLDLFTDSKNVKTPEFEVSFYNKVAIQEEHMCLLLYSVEYLFVADPLSTRWIDLSKEYKANIDKNNNLYNELEVLEKRLACQSEIIFGIKVEGITYSDDEFLLAKGVRAFYNCSRDNVEEALEIVKKDVFPGSVNDKCYEQLDKVSRNYLSLLYKATQVSSDKKEEKEDKPSVIDIQQITSNRLDEYMQILKNCILDSFYRKDDSFIAIKPVVCKFIVFALKNWYFEDLLYAFSKMRDFYYLETTKPAYCCDDVKKLVFYTINSLLCDKKDVFFYEVSAKFGRLQVEELRNLIKYALKDVNAKKSIVYKFLKSIADFIPVDMLEELVDWSVNLEHSGNTIGWSISYLDLWMQILPYIKKNKTRDYVISKLKPVVLESCTTSTKGYSLKDFYYIYLFECNDETRMEVIDYFIKYGEDKNTFYIWELVFNVSWKSDLFWGKYSHWLKENIRSDYYKNFLFYSKMNTKSSCSVKSKLKKEIVLYTENRINNRLLSSHNNINVFTLYNHCLLRSFKWTTLDKNFIQTIWLAVSNSNKFVGAELEELFLYFAEILDNSSENIFDYITSLIPLFFDLPSSKYMWASSETKILTYKVFVYTKYIINHKEISKINLDVLTKIESFEELCLVHMVFRMHVYLSLNVEKKDERLMFFLKSEEHLSLRTKNDIDYNNNIVNLIKEIFFMLGTKGGNLETCILKTQNIEIRELLLQRWKQSFIKLSKNDCYTIRFEVVNVIIRWKKLSEESSVIFPKEFYNIIKDLQNDDVYKVRNICRTFVDNIK